MTLDRYGDQFVLQLTTLGMDQRKEILINAIREVLGREKHYRAECAAVRRPEELRQQTSGVLYGEARPAEFEICGVKFSIDLLYAQKTGFYLDQVPHYSVVAGLAGVGAFSIVLPMRARLH